jgi:RimJ/RimL family protein N-acetyltransferase
LSNHPAFYIESEEIGLLPLNYEQLCLYGQPELMAKTLGLRNCLIQCGEPFDEAFEDALENFWKPMSKENPQDYEWFTNWLIVLKFENTTIGGIGLSGKPNEKGETETGYAIDIHYRGKGYMTQALALMCKWFFEQNDTKSLIAHTMPNGIISQKTLIKNGFELIGPEVTDDGEVLLWRKTHI